jgi:hypothetical protein
MLLSSMDHLNYYSMPKESFLQLDTGLNDGGYDLQGDDQYLNEENSPKNGTKSSLYKTELCKRFSEFGNCRYGAKCQFAHGLGELRHVVRHPKYKTTKCKSYWGSGHCPYGSRCRFIHEEVEGFSTPQYSPQGSSGMGMGSMFMSNENDHMGVGLGSLGVASVPSDLGNNSTSYLYGGGADHPNQPLHALGGVPSYPKDYSLLSSFDKSGSWGAMGGPTVPPRTSTQSKLNYAGDHHLQQQQQQQQQQQSLHHHFGPSPGGSSGLMGSMPLSSPTNHHHHHSNNTSNSNSNYPDLQDAIDALMKFSLTQDDEDEDGVPPAASPRAVSSGSASSANAPIGTISTSPVETSASAVGSSSSTVNAGSADPLAAKLESDELWKDFPVASVQSSVEKLDTTSWSSGLVLNLENSKPFDVNEKKSGSGSEHSPRLSVFERFH